jgi:GNAT superfamily N-acetyltransferase
LPLQDNGGAAIISSIESVRDGGRGMKTGEQPSLLPPDAALAQRLPAVARRIFTETFGHLYDPAPFDAYCDRVYGPGGGMEMALVDPAIRWLVAAVAGAPIGYAKLTPLSAPAPSPLSGAMELQQLYVSAEWHGKGIADALMTWALDTARGLGAGEIYLTVFDHNARAKSFYTRHGFRDVGACTFTLGDRVDEDRIWRRPLG